MISNRTFPAFLFFTICILFCQNRLSAVDIQAPLLPKHEVRAVWLTTIGGLDWPHSYARGGSAIERQKAELTAMLDRLQHAGINTVLFQTRIRGTVIYPSDIEPWDGCCSGAPGQSPGYDPLAFAIAECHRRGMEIQAWIVAIPVGRWNGLGCRTLRNKYPKMIVRRGDEGFIDPSNPSSAAYIASICREITGRYDIDGIHLDYIRYPETWNVNSSMKDAARRNITAIVRQVSAAVKGLKPWVKMSCSPIGKHSDLSRYSSRGWNAWNKGCQAAQQWLADGLMDQLYPMMYFREDQFYPFVMDWIENSSGRTVVPGLGVYFLSPREADWPAEDIKRQMNVLRTLRTGFAFFRAKFLCDDIKGIYRFTSDQTDLWPALVPPMTWVHLSVPESPLNLKTASMNGNTTLTWDAPRQNPSGGILYNVYASTIYPVDINDPRNLIAMRLDRRQVSFAATTPMHYAVTTIDRYGQESPATTTPGAKRNVRTGGSISNDGRYMLLPEKDSSIDADFIVIETQRGQIAATIPWRGQRADITRLPDGVYSVKTLNRRNITHHIGTLIIDRR